MQQRFCESDSKQGYLHLNQRDFEWSDGFYCYAFRKGSMFWVITFVKQIHKKYCFEEFIESVFIKQQICKLVLVKFGI